MEARAAQGYAWATCATACVLLTACVGLAVVEPTSPPGFDDRSVRVVGAVALLGAPVLGAVLTSSREGLRYGRWWCLLGLGAGITWFAEASLSYAVGAGMQSLAMGWGATMGDLGWVLAVTAMPFLLLHFPDGAAPSPRWHRLEVTVLGAAIACVVGLLVFPGDASIAPVQGAVLTSAVPGIGRGLVVVGAALLLLSTPVALVALVLRFRRAADPERSQITWVVYAAVVLGLSLIVLTWWDAPGLWDPVLEAVPLVGLYVAVGIAVLRHRVIDVDLLVNRSLVYGVLSAVLLAAYIAIVAALSAVFDTWASLPITIVATAVICIALQPLRERLQRSVNRRLYGERDEPFAVISRLARTLECAIPTEEVLPTVVRTTAQALNLPHASIWRHDHDRMRLAAAYGTAPNTVTVGSSTSLMRVLERGDPVPIEAFDEGPLRRSLVLTGANLAYPLQHRGEPVGMLCLAPRSPSEAWTRQDRATLADLARQAGAAVHATILADELQRSLTELRRSREALVAAQEHERRRIQRDLHDGLGPVLSAARLHLEASIDPAVAMPARTRRSLERIHDLIGQATTEIRRIVEDLHPPLLSQLGLVAALRAHVEQFGHDVGVTVRLRADRCVDLPPAVEVGVFRVVQEALTNVAKHAGARNVEVRLSTDRGNLHLVVRDDGCGMPSLNGRVGSGLLGMRERAELLGGRLVVGRAAGSGTELMMTVPTEGLT